MTSTPPPASPPTTPPLRPVKRKAEDVHLIALSPLTAMTQQFRELVDRDDDTSNEAAAGKSSALMSGASGEGLAHHNTAGVATARSQQLGEAALLQARSQQTGEALPVRRRVDFEHFIAPELHGVLMRWQEAEAEKRKEQRIRDAIAIRANLEFELQEVRKQDLETMRVLVAERIAASRAADRRKMRDIVVKTLQDYITALQTVDSLVDMKTTNA